MNDSDFLFFVYFVFHSSINRMNITVKLLKILIFLKKCVYFQGAHTFEIATAIEVLYQLLKSKVTAGRLATLSQNLVALSN